MRLAARGGDAELGLPVGQELRPLAAVERLRREAGRDLHRMLEARPAAQPQEGVAVEVEDEAEVAGRLPGVLAHHRIAAVGAETPVDAAQRIARTVLAYAEELARFAQGAPGGAVREVGERGADLLRGAEPVEARIDLEARVRPDRLRGAEPAQGIRGLQPQGPEAVDAARRDEVRGVGFLDRLAGA